MLSFSSLALPLPGPATNLQAERNKMTNKISHTVITSELNKLGVEKPDLTHVFFC